MQTTETGRYCENCEKHIVDLSTKSDAELIRFFNKKEKNVCGRLFSSQLNRELKLPSSKVNLHWWLPFAMSVVVFPVQAEQLKPLIEQNNQALDLSKSSVDASNKPAFVVNAVSGNVVDEQNGKPLKGVKIRQKGFENVLALTDSSGKFQLGLSEENKTAIFTFELQGYSRVEAMVTNGIVIKLFIIRTIMLGGISTVTLNQGPMYLINAGKKSCTIEASRLSEIQVDWIEKTEVLKGANATALYGSKAANGVVIIKIKKAYEKKIDFSKKK